MYAKNHSYFSVVVGVVADKFPNLRASTVKKDWAGNLTEDSCFICQKNESSLIHVICFTSSKLNAAKAQEAKLISQHLPTGCRKSSVNSK